jgi:hypothetical protein
MDPKLSKNEFQQCDWWSHCWKKRYRHTTRHGRSRYLTPRPATSQARNEAPHLLVPRVWQCTAYWRLRQTSWRRDSRMQSNDGMVIRGQTDEIKKENASVQLHSTWISLAVGRDRTRDVALRSLCLVTWAKARPFIDFRNLCMNPLEIRTHSIHSIYTPRYDFTSWARHHRCNSSNLRLEGATFETNRTAGSPYLYLYMFTSVPL